MPEQVTGCIKLDESDDGRTIFGVKDRNLKLLKLAYGVELTARGGTIRITGGVDEVNRVCGVLNHIIGAVRRHRDIAPSKIENIIDDYLSAGTRSVNGGGSPEDDISADGEEEFQIISPGANSLAETGKNHASPPLTAGSRARPRTAGQRTYMDTMRRKDLVFVIGPAGTGKTYLAVAHAVDELRNNNVHKIVLTRPAVEAGERLGFLPGDFAQKVHPYLKPLFDALEAFMHPRQMRSLIERETIEIAPLAYMRGRTLDRAFIILDEAQNTTKKQMKMFLTRMGIGSRAVVTGDITQIDLLENAESGLIHAIDLVKDISGVDVCYLTRKDIVRHRLVQSIVLAYDELLNAATADEETNGSSSGTPV